MSKQSFFFYIPLLKLMNYSYMHDIMHPACNVLSQGKVYHVELLLTREHIKILCSCIPSLPSWYLSQKIGAALGSILPSSSSIFSSFCLPPGYIILSLENLLQYQISFSLSSPYSVYCAYTSIPHNHAPYQARTQGGGSGGFGRTPLSAGIPLITVRKLCRTLRSFTSRPANSTWTSSRCAALITAQFWDR